jgi:hypothetical protein
MLKYNRAKSMSIIGSCPKSFDAMWDAIPIQIKQILSGKLLAQLVDANWHLAGTSKAIAARDIVAEGYVYDAKNQRSIALAA